MLNEYLRLVFDFIIFLAGIGIGFLMTQYRRRRRGIWVVHKRETIRLHSKWELYTFQYLKDNGYDFMPQPKPPIPYIDRLGKLRRYTPDFLVYDKEIGNYYIEIKPKRFLSRRVKHKLQAASKETGAKIVVWTEDELEVRQIFRMYKPRRR